MDIEAFRDYCLSVKGAIESFPFNDNTLVFKVMNKMFAYGSIDPKDGEFNFNMKCNSDMSIDLREKYCGICKGKHTTSNLWNAVYLNRDVPDSLIKELIQHSVAEVIKNYLKQNKLNIAN
ncbi:MmcQ/YjbR family DNA-binding protein [Apibacter sp. HY039]|uniref:MmcQ/YjbR family DNA-binding protein n=1 Tax=Apibacter sp. HY039 TaxID=2501476 RepID=UPI000FEB5DA9|nr:MmcQ/YjbR family DNA-binding protein [Apibacter sp. HY039]